MSALLDMLRTDTDTPHPDTLGALSALCAGSRSAARKAAAMGAVGAVSVALNDGHTTAAAAAAALGSESDFLSTCSDESAFLRRPRPPHTLLNNGGASRAAPRPRASNSIAKLHQRGAGPPPDAPVDEGLRLCVRALRRVLDRAVDDSAPPSLVETAARAAVRAYLSPAPPALQHFCRVVPSDITPQNSPPGRARGNHPSTHLLSPPTQADVFDSAPPPPAASSPPS